MTGRAVVIRNGDGTRSVKHADAEIWVSTELLASPDNDPDFIEPDGTLRLDTAGEYRYRFVRVADEHAHVYERITP